MAFNSELHLQRHIRSCFDQEEAQKWEIKCTDCFEKGLWAESLCTSQNKLQNHIQVWPLTQFFSVFLFELTRRPLGALNLLNALLARL